MKLINFSLQRVPSSIVVQFPPLSNNDLLNNAGQGAGECEDPHAEHDLRLWHCSYLSEVEYEDSGDDSVECEHEEERNCENPQRVMKKNNTQEREWTKDNYHYQGEVQNDYHVAQVRLIFAEKMTHFVSNDKYKYILKIQN